MKQKITSFFSYFLLLVIFVFGQQSFEINIRKSQIADKKSDEILVKYNNSDIINTVKINNSENYNKILEYYKNLPDVEYAEPDYTYEASILPTDTNFNNQWYLQKIKAVEAWDEIRESPKVIIAILDSGVQINHPDLKSNIWINNKEISGNNIDDDKNGFIDDINGWDFINDVPDPNPKFKPGFTEAGILHGTIVAGIAAASGNNAAGIAGVTWKAQIMPLKVLDDTGEGNTSKVIKAIDYAINNRADIINLSFVGFGFSKSLDDAIKRAYQAGVLIVAAGGNEQDQGSGYSLDDSPMYPVCHDGSNKENWVIGVAATDTIDQKTAFSSYGFKCIDIAAPGVSVFSTVVYSPTDYINDRPFNKYYDGYWSGTSVAVPMVSGALALIEAANPGLNRDQVVKILYDSADNIYRVNPTYLSQLGKGRLNLDKAVDQALSPLKSKTEKILVAPLSGHQSQIKVADLNGNVDKIFQGFGNFQGGANLASGDVNGDGQAEIILAAGPGGGPHIKIFNRKYELIGQFFAYSEKFRGGVNIASADLNKDGFDEIITSPASQDAPFIKIFSYKGKLKSYFLAYDNNFRGGAYLAAGDVDGDGENEIITGPGASAGPQVKIWKANGQLKGQFFAYAQSFRGGVRVAVGDVNGGIRGNKKEIITAPGKSGGPHIRIFDNKGGLIGQFFAYNFNFRGGVSVATIDIDNDGLAEIITGAGIGGAPHVKIFEANSTLIGSFYAYEDNFISGVNVGSFVIK